MTSSSHLRLVRSTPVTLPRARPPQGRHQNCSQEQCRMGRPGLTLLRSAECPPSTSKLYINQFQETR